MNAAAAAFNHDCSLNRRKTASNSGLGRPPPTPAWIHTVRGNGTHAAASQMAAESNVQMKAHVNLFLLRLAGGLP